jgi:hypothetical protein
MCNYSAVIQISITKLVLMKAFTAVVDDHFANIPDNLLRVGSADLNCRRLLL